MLLDVIRQGFTAEAIIKLALYFVIVLISLSVHELFHGYVAYRCGDATARNLGRLTLNPLSHLDIIGTIMMLLFGFGYAKPVPINPRNFNHYKRDLCFVSFAGPFSNLMLAFFGVIVYLVSIQLIGFTVINSPSYFWIYFLYNFIFANISLAIFNMLPIPPLDGSRIISTILPSKLAYYYLKYEQVIMIVVLLLLWQGAFSGILFFLSEKVFSGIFWLARAILWPLLKIL